MSKAIMRDEDSQVIHMVNANTAFRRQKAEEAYRERQAQAEDTEAMETGFRERKKTILRVAETAGKVVLGLGFIAAAQFGFVVGWMGAAMALVCFIWAAVSWKRETV